MAEDANSRRGNPARYDFFAGAAGAKSALDLIKRITAISQYHLQTAQSLAYRHLGEWDGPCLRLMWLAFHIIPKAVVHCAPGCFSKIIINVLGGCR